jgi:hypothetical protein
LEKFLKTYEGEKDSNFWNCAYKIHSKEGSGGLYDWESKYVNGWINNFFPYNENGYRLKRNFVNINEIGEVLARGIVLHSFPSGITQTPFIWKNSI